jgi:hypothetical protein
LKRILSMDLLLSLLPGIDSFPCQLVFHEQIPEGNSETIIRKYIIDRVI